MRDAVEIDGSEGEGGGQILRTSFALAALTGTPVRVTRVRARRARPGLMRQHLTAVRAAATICEGRLEGDEPGSRTVSLWPGQVRAGDYRFAVGTAGSTTLVLQTVLWPLLLAGRPSTVRVEGGTHNPLAPPAEFMMQSLFPLLATMGAKVSMQLVRHGFYPAGGGCLAARIEGAEEPRALSLLERGPVTLGRARALVSGIGGKVPERELEVVRNRMDWPRTRLLPEEVEADGPGNALLLEVEHAGGTTVVTAMGERKKRAEQVAEEAVAELQAFLRAEVPVDVHLADQLLLPMALLGGGRFRTLPPSLHTRTQAALVQRFLPVEIAMTDRAGSWDIEVRRRGAGSSRA